MTSSNPTAPRPPSVDPRCIRKRSRGFIERTLTGLARRLDRSLYAEELARADGLLQRLDPRTKIIGLLALSIATALTHQVLVILAIFTTALVLALLSRVPMRTLAFQVWLGIFLFTGPIVLPALFLTPGPVIYRLPWLGWLVTAPGARSAMYLLTRVETAATLSLLLVLCTPWSHVLKALSVLGVPAVFLMILGMTYRYIFLFLQTAHDMFEARRSRMIGVLDGPERRRLAAATVGVLLSKSLYLSNEVYLAMQSRGFRGAVYTLDDFRMRSRDGAALAGFLFLAALAVWWGR